MVAAIGRIVILSLLRNKIKTKEQSRRVQMFSTEVSCKWETCALYLVIVDRSIPYKLT